MLTPYPESIPRWIHSPALNGFSTLDLISGYWQVQIGESDRPKTAFCTTEWEHCLVYMDDVIILGRTCKEHIQNIQLVLQRLREVDLKVKPSKCVFF